MTCRGLGTPEASHRKTAQLTRRSSSDNESFTAELLDVVAGIIPVPRLALSKDVASWRGFDDLVTEAADLVVGVVGPDGAASIRSLMSSAGSKNPVHQTLLERVLQRLDTDDQLR